MKPNSTLNGCDIKANQLVFVQLKLKLSLLDYEVELTVLSLQIWADSLILCRRLFLKD